MTDIFNLEKKIKMDWTKLTPTEIKDFLEANGSGLYIKWAEELFKNRTPETVITEPVADLWIASNYWGIIPQIYDIDKIRRLSKKKLAEFSHIFGIEPNVEKIVRILRYLGALSQPNYWEILPTEILHTVAFQLAYEDVLCLGNTCHHKLNNLCKDPNFWRDKTVRDFNLTLQAFNELLENDRSVIFISKYDITFSQVRMDVGQFGEVVNLRKYGNYYLVNYADPQYAASIIKYHSQLTNPQVEKFDWSFIQKYNPRLVYVIARENNFLQSYKTNFPPGSGAIVLSNIHPLIDTNIINHDFSLFGVILAIEKFDSMFIVTYKNQTDIRKIYRAYANDKSIFVSIIYSEIAINTL